MVLKRIMVGAVLGCALNNSALAENPAAEFETPTVEVIGTTPVQGVGLPINQIPANVQAVSGKDIQQQQSLDLSEYLDNNIGGVSVNQGQNNPFQPDVFFRGLTASPLLGTPQGLSVYLDGVRVNEPFGDVVNWDLIPENAISSINLIPGSNPVFGLNTLGAALSVNTKSGFQYPGGTASVYGGSWGRKALEAEYGGHEGDWDWFVAGNIFKEDGWRDHSPSLVRQLFAKVGRQTEHDDFDLSLMIANNDLQGTQSLPASWLDTRKEAYTWPDRNLNEVQQINFRGSLYLAPEHLVAGNVYYRRYKNTNTSSNVNDTFDGTPPNGCDGTGAGGPCTGINDKSIIDTNGFGAAAQYSLLSPMAGMKNQLSAGATMDLGKTEFKQFSQNATFTADRNAIEVDPFTLSTHADTSTSYYGLYATDSLSLSEEFTLTLSGRYNLARVKIEDKSGTAPQLNGNHKFTRLNPAIGLNFNPNKSLTTYASYSEGMRVPTAMELTCADPVNPCRLPNNFLADPPLRKVVGKTIEFGARGKVSKIFEWGGAIYRTTLNDDIVFVSSSGSTNAGYFQNVPRTRRQGLELGIRGSDEGFSYALNYGLVKATFESDFVIFSPNNSTATGGDIQIHPGNKIPGVPQQTAKLRLGYSTDTVSVGTNIVYSGAQYARGDENNQDAGGKIPSYTLVHLDGHVNLGDGFEVFLRVQNLFNRNYETFGVLGENFFNGAGRSFDQNLAAPEQFRSVGAPRAAWIGLRYEFGGKKNGAATKGQDD